MVGAAASGGLSADGVAGLAVTAIPVSHGRGRWAECSRCRPRRGGAEPVRNHGPARQKLRKCGTSGPGPDAGWPAAMVGRAPVRREPEKLTRTGVDKGVEMTSVAGVMRPTSALLQLACSLSMRALGHGPAPLDFSMTAERQGPAGFGETPERRLIPEWRRGGQ